MLRIATLFVLVLLLDSRADARTGVCLLNCSSPITVATPGAVLVGDTNHDWVQRMLPTACPTPGGFTWNGTAFVCGGGAASWLQTGRSFFAGALITGDLYVGTGDSNSSAEQDVVSLAPTTGTVDTFCCDLETAPGGSGVTFTFRAGTTVAGLADTALSVSYSAGQSGRRCDTPTDAAMLSAGYWDVKWTNPALGTSGRGSCGARLRTP